MIPNTYRLRNTVIALAACIFFCLAGLAFAPHLGIEDDEAIFGQAIFHPRAELYSIRIGHSHLPLMLMTYLGTLKAWIYRPLFRAFGTGILTLRVPMILAAALSIYIFYLLLRRIAGEGAALIGCCLLASDSAYLLTACFDWGPVALQHLLLLGGMYLLLRFHQTRVPAALAGGCLLLGLALWDKALAIWMFGGLATAGILTFPRQIFVTINRRNVATAVLAFGAGASPLLIYNVANGWGTFHGNFKRDTSDLAGKARFLANTAGGAGLFGWMLNEDWQTPRPHAPSGALQRASAYVSELAGHPRHHLLLYCFFLALLLAPLARGNDLRSILFGLIALAVAWIQMAITANAGGSVHHTILLWPIPQMVVAIAFAAAARRLGRAGAPVLAAVAAVATISGVLVVNEYYCVMLRDGGGESWTDAIFALSDYINKVPAKSVVCLDWGILDPLRILHGGRLPLVMGSDQLAQAQMTPADRQAVMQMVADPENVFIAHTKGYEFFPGISTKLVQIAGENAYEQRPIAVISDTYGHAVYEIYRFAARE